MLIDKGVAYKGGDGSIYYADEKFPRYGCLSHFNLEDLKVGASERIATDEYEKEHVADFVIWKSYDKRDGKIYWDSPFGREARLALRMLCDGHENSWQDT